MYIAPDYETANEKQTNRSGAASNSTEMPNKENFNQFFRGKIAKYCEDQAYESNSEKDKDEDDIKMRFEEVDDELPRLEKKFKALEKNKRISMENIVKKK